MRAAHAIIAIRKNAKPWRANRCGADARNDILRTTKRVGRAIWKRWSGNHRRSLVETRMCCFELLGEGVMARDFDRRVAELQVEKVSDMALSLSLADVQADAAAIRTAASESATIQSTLAPGMTALTKELRSAKLLVAD